MLLDLLRRITESIQVYHFCLFTVFFFVCLGYFTLEGTVLVYMSKSVLDLTVMQCFPETFLVCA